MTTLWGQFCEPIDIDLAKHVFQVHGVDASGRVVVAKAIRRKHLLEFFASLPPCLVASRPPARGIIGRASDQARP